METSSHPNMIHGEISDKASNQKLEEDLSSILDITRIYNACWAPSERVPIDIRGKEVLALAFRLLPIAHIHDQAGNRNNCSSSRSH